MKYVAAAPSSPASRAGLPDAKLLEAARELAGRFPQAGLRACGLLRAAELDGAAGGRAWLALELLQVTGSFKVRGALLALGRLRDTGADEVIAASAGNHGAGVAYAARVLGMRATVVVPKNAPLAKRARIEGEGATLHVSGAAGYDEAEREAMALAEDRSIAFLSPYDDVAVVAGNGASLGYEIAASLGQPPGVVLAPFGGGGLATGLACALPESGVYGAQSEASSAFALSLERGAAVEALPAEVETLADGLEGGISRAAFERARSVVHGVLVMPERAIGHAMAFLHRSLGMAAEGSAAVALAPLLGGSGLPVEVRPSHEGARPDVVVVLTGRNVDDSRLCQVLRDHDGPT